MFSGKFELAKCCWFCRTAWKEKIHRNDQQENEDSVQSWTLLLSYLSIPRFQ